MDKKGLLEWAKENLEGHSVSSTEILLKLEPFGLEWAPEGKDVRLTDPGTGATTILYVTTYEQMKQSMIRRGMGLVILDKSKPADYIAYYSAKGRELRVDAEGNLAKTAKPAYAVIGGDQFPVGWFGSTLTYNPDIAFVDELSLMRALHRLYGADNAFSSRMHGVGSAGRAMLQEMEETLATE